MYHVYFEIYRDSIINATSGEYIKGSISARGSFVWDKQIGNIEEYDELVSEIQSTLTRKGIDLNKSSFEIVSLNKL